MRKVAVAIVAAGLVAVGCGGDQVTADPTAEVLGVQITEEGGELETVPAAPSPTPGPRAASSTRNVASTRIEGNLNWGAADGDGCTAIGDALSLDQDNYALATHVHPLVEGDCPDWQDSYDLGCDIGLQSALEHSTVMVGQVVFELLVDGEVEATWSMDVDEELLAGEATRLGTGETVTITSADQPEVTCRATFTAA